MIVGQSNQNSAEFGTLTRPGGGQPGDGETLDSKAEEAAGPKLEKIAQEIVNLYLKIKRCSKDVNITESQYLNHMETVEDREERLLIAQMDPMIVLQYINVSIDVIINLKFEDIENKMAETARKRDALEKKKYSQSKPSKDRKELEKGNKQENGQDDQEKNRAAEGDKNTNGDLEISNQLEELVVEDTP